MKTLVWAERVGWLDVLPLAACAWSGREIRYDERRAGAVPLAALRALAASATAPAGLTLAAVDARGEALNYAKEEELERAIDGYLSQARPAWSRFQRRMAKSFVANALLPQVTFLVMARHAALAFPQARHEFYVSGGPAYAVLEKFYGELSLRRSPAPRAWLRAWASPGLLLALLAWAALRKPSCPASSSLASRRSIWVEYYPTHLDGYASRAFWSKGVETRFAVAFYVDRPDTDCGEETRRNIESAGFLWADLRRPWRWARLDAASFLALIASFLRSLAAPAAWLSLYELEAGLWTALWTDVFRRNRVNLLLQHQDFDWRQGAQAAAIERAGGAMMGLHWAECPFIEEPIHMTPMHVFFAWGSNQALRLEGKGHEARHVLPSGVWMADDAGKQAQLKEKLNGAVFSLAIFDSSAAYDIFQSPRQLSDFLLAVLKEVRGQKGWKAVLKPKSTADYRDLPEGDRLNALIAELSGEGRLIVADHRISPIAACRAADLAVGFAVNSAVMLGCSRGARGIHWDAPGWKRHPVYQDPCQKLFYRTLDSLLAAAREAAAGDLSVGDFSRHASGVDHFSDGRAAERVAGWINDFMGLLEAGQAPLPALDQAAGAYRKRWSVAPDAWAAPGWWRPRQFDGRMSNR